MNSIIVNGLNINYDVEEVKVNHYDNYVTEFVINIGFDNSRKKRMTTKILNEIKLNHDFQKFIKTTIENKIAENYINININSINLVPRSFQHQSLAVWLVIH